MDMHNDSEGMNMHDWSEGMDMNNYSEGMVMNNYSEGIDMDNHSESMDMHNHSESMDMDTPTYHDNCNLNDRQIGSQESTTSCTRTSSIHPNLQTVEGGKNEPTTGESTTSTDEDDYKDLKNLDILDHTQQHIQNIPHIKFIYTAYHKTYTDPAATKETRMVHAKRLAFTLLKHYYPESQGYVIEPTSLGPIARKGINFMLKAPEEPDSDPDTNPVKSKDRKKKKKTVARKTDLHTYYSYSANWHMIEPEDMAALVVKQRFQTVNDNVQQYTYRPLTYVAIAIDDLSTFNRWSKVNDVHRGDILTHVLGMQAKIQQGYGIMIFGPRIEFYDYTAADENHPITAFKDENWSMDMRSTSLHALDAIFKKIMTDKPVHYMNGDMSLGGEITSE